MPMPTAERAVIDIRKLRDYCLNPLHDEGQDKARMFATALGVTAEDAEDLRVLLLQAVKTVDVQLRRCMAHTIKLLDVVALTVDLPEYNRLRGQVDTVLEMLAGGTAFEVEFSNREGRTDESLGLRPDQLMVLHYEPVATQP